MAIREQLIQDIVIQQVNAILGTNGDDSLMGTTGSDAIAGLGGSDSVIGAGGNDLIIGNAGEDHLFSQDGPDILSGGSEDDTLSGGEGADALNGGTGNDYMLGRDGNDRYVVDSEHDLVDEEDFTDPADAIYSFINLNLPDKIEGLNLLGNAFIGRGNLEHNMIFGNSNGNLLSGTLEFDQSGKSSADTDTLAGGAGNDIYLVDSVDDKVLEDVNQGNNDTIISSVTYHLPNNVENIVLAGLDPTLFTDAFGNELNNTLRGDAATNHMVGRAGDDLLFGGSGGEDTLDGGQDSDQYFAFNLTDTMVDSGTRGIDQVHSFVQDYILPETIENLVLEHSGEGTGVNGTGNDKGNLIDGNDLGNSLSGGLGNDSLDGAQGDDTLNGGEGDDTYLFRLGDGMDEISRDGDFILNQYDDFDTVRFDGFIAQDQIAFFNNAPFQPLEIGYTNDDTDLIKAPTNIFGTLVERFQLANGLFMNSADVTRLESILSNFAGARNISFQSLQDVKDSPRLMSIINDSWRVGPNAPFTPVAFPLPIIGRDRADTYNGTNTSNTFIGAGGNDDLFGAAGDDYLMGNEGNDTVYGGHGNDTLMGGSGNDELDGYSFRNFIPSGDNDVLNGGTGADLMRGWQGDDVYIVDNLGDNVIERPDEGYDTVNSFINLVIPDEVEELRLLGTAVVGIGSGNSETLVGNDSDNTLDSMGGIDTLKGGAGNDTYRITNGRTTIIENAGEGNLDIVQSPVNFTLPDNVEQLFLTGGADLEGTGNSQDNILSSNGAHDTLIGLAGDDILRGSLLGLDSLVGGIGNDRYVVFNRSTDISESNVDNGQDEVTAFSSYVLPDNVENLILADTFDGFPLNTRGTGNTGNNFLQGGAGINTLIGGDGNDTLIGGLSGDLLQGERDNDTYQFRAGDGRDIVDDLSGDKDTIRFTSTIAQDNIAFFFNTVNNTMEIGFTGDDFNGITVDQQTASSASIERFEIQDGLFMTAEDVSKVMALVNKFAGDHGIDLFSVDNVRDNPELMTIINSGWHA